MMTNFLRFLLPALSISSFHNEDCNCYNMLGLSKQKMMEDIVNVWRMFRDPLTGFWCDNLYFAAHPDDPPTNPCGPEVNLYSAAGTGMGLVSEAIMAELGNHSIQLY